MGLSEQRRKQRLVGSATTHNNAWVNDTSLPGQRLMASMGWAPGTGLGTSGSGMASNLTVSMKLDNKGIGAQRHEKEALQQNKADAWVGAGGDLGSLFERLNSANANETTSSVTAQEPAPVRMPSGSRLAHRAKFRRAKALAGNDMVHMNEILGICKDADGAQVVLTSKQDQPLVTIDKGKKRSHDDREDSADRADDQGTVLEAVSGSGHSDALPTKESKKKLRKDLNEDMVSGSSKKTKKSKKPKESNEEAGQESESSLKKPARRKDKGRRKDHEEQRESSSSKSKKRSEKDKDARQLPKRDMKPSHTASKSSVKEARLSVSQPDSNDSLQAKSEPTSDDEESNTLIFSSSGQTVFQYLSNKLIRRRAEVQKQRRDTGKWW
ncbi:hypothetical protein MYAM1_003003 [Malassezia yamatoensis]|uniref:PinX1-related protein 1 n=1 Tax=Malassezia yamatoensis TaxID=253288 RepID=A0AAJ5Z0Z8_9BASI|nr:hypothetical protein MYAM1_003003 [Malassezia yamatoensis]